ncbi:hypothetical protein Micbo1qcDRAFT_171839 [Microdochium bolleyi]|uniref:F-box domain-containing protein n=1 Tax=Microdochium bolleyi TaxID=196109 RepID=A0A136JEB2_9PEZI|nr:hypothetical protein Micbo1qcDRAFT_171839 [Microdochium bolleyi]
MLPVCYALVLPYCTVCLLARLLLVFCSRPVWDNSTLTIATINSLANEVLDLVVQNLKTRELARMCRVSKRWDTVIRPWLWRTIELDPVRCSSQLTIVSSLLRKPSLGLFTRELSMKEMRGYGDKGEVVYPTIDFTTDPVRQWLAETYSAAFAHWVCSVAPKAENSRSQTLGFLAVFMPYLESITYDLMGSRGFLTKLAKLCGSHSTAGRAAAGIMNTPLKKLKSLSLWEVAYSDPLAIRPEFASIIAQSSLHELTVHVPEAGAFRVARPLQSSLEKLEVHYAPLDADTIKEALEAFPRLKWINFCTCGSPRGWSEGMMDLDEFGNSLRQLGTNLTMLNLSLRSKGAPFGGSDSCYGRLGSLRPLTSLQNLVIFPEQWLGYNARGRDHIVELLPVSIRTIAFSKDFYEDGFDEDGFDESESYDWVVQELLSHHDALPELFCIAADWTLRKMKIKSRDWESCVARGYGFGMAFVLRGTAEARLVGLEGNHLMRNVHEMLRSARQRRLTSNLSK